MSKEMTEAQAWQHINEMFGGAVRHPDELEKLSVFTTRSPALDRALQIGGWAKGRIYQMAGKPSSGKTFMALIAMAEWQSQDPENCCCFIDAEYTYDSDWASKLGVDNERVLLIKTNEAQKIFEGLVGRPKVNKATGKMTQTPGLLDMIREGHIITHVVKGKPTKLNLGKMGIIVLDSVAAMAAPSEVSSEVGKIQVAPLSRFLTVELRKLTPAVADANVCFIAINHVKTQVGVMFGNPETTPGGAAWKHACSVMLMVAPMSGSENVLEDKNEEKYGHKIRVKVEKNKMGKPFKTAEFFINFTSGVAHKNEQLLDLGCMYNVIERPNNRTYIINGERLASRELALDYITKYELTIENLVRSAYLDGGDVTVEGEGREENFPDAAEELFE
jgi:recombination protein RecA